MDARARVRLMIIGVIKARFWLCALIWLCALLVGLQAAAAHELSDYEREVQTSILNETGLVVDEAPAGKRIEGIDVFVIDPFDARDPVPAFVNSAHVNSRDYVVRQVLAVKAGDRYDERLIDDSLQGLRATQKFSLVLLVAVRGATPDSVRLLVIAKDIWSLRLNWDPEFIDGKWNLLLLNPSEVNFLGTHSTLAALYQLEPDRTTIGGALYKPQVGGSNIGIYLAGGSIRERGSGNNEGSYGYFRYYRPFKSSYERWAWSVGMGWRDEVTRHYQGAAIRTFDFTGPSGAEEQIPEVFETDRLAGEYELTRSFGTLDKYNFSLGMEADRRRYRAPPQVGQFSPEAQLAFEQSVLPTSDSRISPFGQIRARSLRFLRLVNVETLALQEDLWVGHDALLRVYPASHKVGSSRTLLGVQWAIGYSVALGGGIVRSMLRANIEVSALNRNDVEFEAGARLVSPNMGVGRLHVDLLALDRYRNYLNRPDYVLGGQNRLRGYELSAFRGDQVAVVNLEFRSLPVEVLGVHAAGAAFYDTGDASATRPFHFKHSVGLGCRLLFPQFDRTVFRVDWGLPLNGETPGLPGGVIVAFDQAFSMPLVDEPSVLDGVLPF